MKRRVSKTRRGLPAFWGYGSAEHRSTTEEVAAKEHRAAERQPNTASQIQPQRRDEPQRGKAATERRGAYGVRAACWRCGFWLSVRKREQARRTPYASRGRWRRKMF